ncbi:hypothetical protein ACTMTI_08705 [Nonomuraea sp. H19]|uniref:hypothetical protein n=1 Tax=Nonomuraea sp. H19 TaxID=3452206 RepID=UPI003F88A4FF
MNELKHLARVRDEDLSGQASGAGARALLASITAEEPVLERARRLPSGARRLTFGAVIAAGLAAAAVIGPAVLGEQGPATSYANAAIDIELRGDTYVATIKDPLADHAKYTEGFKAVGLNVNLEVVPAAPSEAGKLMSMSVSGPLASNGESITSSTMPEGCVVGQDGCAITVKVPRDWAGWAAVRVGRAAEPGEKYRSSRVATRKDGMLEGFRVDERTVGEVLAEVRRRGLKAVFQVITPGPDSEGYGVEQDKQQAEVGEGWIVWEAYPAEAGVVLLMVTEERLPKNPIYGGPKPSDLNE